MNKLQTVQSVSIEQTEDILINSVSQFVEMVEKICINENGVKSPYTFFRGEANKDWETIASLLRVNENDPNLQETDVLVQMEYELISNARRCHPELFKSCPDSIDRIVEMQHYGLPTRLLDVTGNPLVALYFACEKEPNNADGKVLYTTKEPFDHRATNIMAALCEYWSDYRSLTVAEKRHMGKSFDYPISKQNESPNVGTFLTILEDEGLCKNTEDSIMKYLFLYLTKSFLYVPYYNNSRIKAQKGAFLFSAFMQPIPSHKSKYSQLLKEIKERELKKNEMESICFIKERTSLRNEFNGKQFIIENKNKKRILKELSLLGINEAFVYPEPEHQMKTVRDEISMNYYHRKKNGNQGSSYSQPFNSI